MGDEQIGPVLGEGIKSSVLSILNLRNLISMWKCQAGGWLY